MSRSAGLLVVLFAVSVSASTARAEGFVDLRVGGAFTEDGDVDIDPGPRVESEFDDSVTGGIRAGYWFDSLPWLGLAADVSYFGPDPEIISGADIEVIPLSPLLMGRVPIATSEEYPHGRIQPFIGVGPGVFISLVDLGPGADDESVDVGFDLHAGLNFQVTPVVSIFGEYRFTHFESDVDVQGFDIETELDTHHIAGGIGFHF